MNSRQAKTRMGPGARAALTLVELLVVIAIIVLLVAVVLPLAQPALQGRNVREAARQINTFFERARSEAIAIGEPVGVELIVSPSSSQRSFEMAMLRQARPFTGLTSTWGATLSMSTIDSDGDGAPDPQLNFLVDLSPPTAIEVAALQNLVRGNPSGTGLGERFEIRFAFREQSFQGVRFDQSGTTFFLLPTSKLTSLLSPAALKQVASGAPFQLMREPRRKASATMELPNGAYIDMSASAVEGGATAFSAVTSSVKIMFDHRGRLYRIFADGVPFDLQDSINLLIARGKATCGDAADPATNALIATPANLAADGGSLWVTLNESSGRIMTTENLGFDPSATTLAGAITSAILASVTTGDEMGGR